MLSFPENYGIDAFADWIQGFVVHQALLAPVVLLFLEESGVPLPIPGDVYLAFVGYQISQGKISYISAFAMLLLAILAGSSVLYFLSAKWGNVIILKVGRYMHLSEKRILLVEKYFKKYGFLVIVFGRHIPGFRIPITFFAGISGVPYRTFIISTFISVVFWIAFYLSLGQKLGRSVLHLFRANQLDYILLSTPFVFFICSILYMHFKNAKGKMKE